MRKPVLDLLVVLAVGGFVGCQSEQKAVVCPPTSPAINVYDGMSSPLPDVNASKQQGTQLQWKSSQQNFTLTIPDPNSPSTCGANPYPNYGKENDSTWDSCALHTSCQDNSYVSYVITFTQTNHSIRGRIIIKP